MKKKILMLLNAEFQSKVNEGITAKFGEIGLTRYFDIFTSTYTSQWKTQGIAKDREIKFFIEGLEAGYKLAVGVVTNDVIEKINP